MWSRVEKSRRLATRETVRVSQNLSSPLVGAAAAKDRCPSKYKFAKSNSKTAEFCRGLCGSVCILPVDQPPSSSSSSSPLLLFFIVFFFCWLHAALAVLFLTCRLVLLRQSVSSVGSLLFPRVFTHIYHLLRIASSGPSVVDPHCSSLTSKACEYALSFPLTFGQNSSAPLNT